MPTINGTTGDDTLNGTSDDDVINGLAGNDALNGGDGNDLLEGGDGDDTIDGGAGVDTASYLSAGAGVSAQLLNSNPWLTGQGTDTLVSIENLWGSNYNDSLLGNEAANWIAGFDGNDEIAGNGGVDVLEGGLGDDTYLIATYPGEHSAAEINDSGGYDTVRIYPGTDATLTLYAGDVGIERVMFQSGRVDGTNIDARAVANSLLIIGNEGTNILWGTAFGDTLDGRGLDDQLTGGAGSDILTGGDGIDRFVDTAAGLNGDTITDFGFNEKIIITDATLAGFTYSLTGNTLTYTGGSLTLDAPVYGRIIASAAEGGGVQLTIGSDLLPSIPEPPGPPNTEPLYLRQSYYNDPMPDFTIGSGTYISMLAQGGSNTLFPWGVGTLTNAGTIYMEDAPPGFSGDMRLASTYDAIPRFENSGTIVLHNQNVIGGGVIALQDNGSKGQVTSITNSGDIYLVSDHFYARFVQTWESRTTITNSGTIGLYTPEGSGLAIYFANGGSVVNLAGGQILVEGQSATGVFVLFPSIDPNEVELNNAGLIVARSLGSVPSIGVYMDATGEVINSGTITADISAYMDGTLTNSGILNGAVLVDEFLTFNNQAGGVLNGNYIGGDHFDELYPNYADHITNAGTIIGDVSLWGGNDSYNGTGGSLQGILDAGAGNDTITGWFDADTFYGGDGNDTLTGNGGDDFLEGGAGDDTLSGGAGFDLASYSEATAGVVINLAITSAQNTGGAGTDTLSGIEDLLGSAYGDQLTGNSQANYLFGIEGDDQLTGGAGADVLTGGSGADAFRDTAAGLNGDKITDFAAGDKITITDASLASFTYSLSGSTLIYSGGTLTLTGFTGQLTASAAAGGGVQLTVAPPDATNDFNGDGRSDVLWRNEGAGIVTSWFGQANGSFIGNTASFTAGANWSVAGTGDFNGDGRDDVLWRNNGTGVVTDWLGQVNGSFTGNTASFTAGNNWTVAGTGDFNGDGRDDVLWRNNGTGVVTDWLGQANGSFVGNTASFTAGTNWSVAGTGDFNGDGRDDVLWRNNGTGVVTDWLGQANGTFAGNTASFTAGTNWSVVGTGDFNGDGRDDVLWRKDAGIVTDWLGQANGSFVGNTASFTAGTNWTVAGTGDFNGDGRDDVLWRSDAGVVTDWLGQANGGFVANLANAHHQITDPWQVQPDHHLI